MIHPNSKLAYEEKVKPTLTQRERAVYDILFIYGELTAWEVALKMSTPERRVTPNQISGRFVPLEFKGFIKQAGKRQLNGSTHTVWKVINPKEEIKPGTQLTIE